MQPVSLWSFIAAHLRDLGRYPRFLFRLLTRPASVRLRGAEIELGERPSKALRRLLYSERYERGESRCVVLNLSPDDVVLEVGAGIGYLSTLCALKLGSERVHTYEADPELIAVIRKNHALNRVAPQVHNAMLAESAGSASFFVSANFFSSSATAPPAGEEAGRPQLEIPTLDARAEFARIRPTFVLMDIEGGEAALVPIVDWSSVRKLAIELHPHILGASGMTAVLEQLRAAGFHENRLLSSNRKRFFYK